MRKGLVAATAAVLLTLAVASMGVGQDLVSGHGLRDDTNAASSHHGYQH